MTPRDDALHPGERPAAPADVAPHCPPTAPPRAEPAQPTAATNGPLEFRPGLESEPFPPPRSNAKTRLTWVRALAQQQNVPWAVVQLADLVQDLIEWRDRHEPDAWDGSDWT